MKKISPGSHKSTPCYISIELVNVVMIGCGFICRLKTGPFIKVYLTSDLVFQTKGMLHIYYQTRTTLLNILQGLINDSYLFCDIRE